MNPQAYLIGVLSGTYMGTRIFFYPSRTSTTVAARSLWVRFYFDVQAHLVSLVVDGPHSESIKLFACFMMMMRMSSLTLIDQKFFVLELFLACESSAWLPGFHLHVECSGP